MIKIRPGLILGMGDFLVKKDLSVTCEYTDLPVIFSFGLSGTLQCSFHRKQSATSCPAPEPGYCTVAHMPKWSGVVTYSAGLSLCGIRIYVDSRVLSTFFNNEESQICQWIKTIINTTEEQPFYRTVPISAMADRVINEIINCPYDAPLKRLYLESKALELITYTITLLAPQKALGQTPPLVSDDLDKIRRAGKMLTLNMETPPDLVKLARSVGMSRSKLHHDFQLVYGITPFEYLRSKRLEKARTMLNQGNFNVTDVAYAVGYASLSHFAKAFKRYFGDSPSNYRNSK